MPHVPEKQRKILRHKIRTLVDVIEIVHSDMIEKGVKEGKEDGGDLRDLDGVMNYVICRLLIEVFDLKNNPKYTKFNTVEGILNQVGRAIYEGFVSPYEQKKIEENGNALLE